MRVNAHSSIDLFTHSLFDEYLLSVPCVLAVGAQRRANPTPAVASRAGSGSR